MDVVILIFKKKIFFQGVGTQQPGIMGPGGVQQTSIMPTGQPAVNTGLVTGILG